MTDKSPLQALVDLVTAWESLPGGTRYSPKTVEKWLADKMSPAINQARVVIKNKMDNFHEGQVS